MVKPIIPEHADPRNVTRITFGRNAYIDALYGSLRVDNPNGFTFETSRSMELVPQSGRTVSIETPARMRIPLPKDAKLIDSDMLSLLPARKHPAALRYITLRAGWNQTDSDLTRITGLPGDRSFIAFVKHRGKMFPVGSGVSAPLGEHHAWIGLVAVVPELRRYGVANEIMTACLAASLADGRIINGLDATPLGHTVYGALGYVDSYRLWRSSFTTAEFSGIHPDRSVIPIIPETIDDVIRYDAGKFLERRDILRALSRDALCAFMAVDGSRVRGYVIVRPGRMAPFVGPLIGDDDAVMRTLAACAGKALSDAGYTSAFMDTPESMFAELPREATDEGKPSHHRIIPHLTPMRNFVRMYHLLDDVRAEELLADYCSKEGLPPDAQRVQRFSRILDRGVDNQMTTRAFMEYERTALLRSMCAISGAEKG